MMIAHTHTHTNTHTSRESEEKLYLVTDYCRGGELFFHLKRMRRFGERMASGAIDQPRPRSTPPSPSTTVTF